MKVIAVEPAKFGAIRDRVIGLEQRAEAVDGSESLGETVWRDLAHPAEDSAAFLTADERAFAHVARTDTFAPQHWALGMVIDPDVRATRVRTPLVKAALAHVAHQGGGQVVCWILGARETEDDDLLALGFVPARGVYELRVPLPIAETPNWPPGVEVRDFQIGRDEAAWLVVNNRAFENHPEQGGWIESTLARRIAEPWFDPSIFLLAFDAFGLLGFNWCKVHDAHGRDPQLGEIFVIGVDPRAQGSGLGRALALAGLQRMADRGISTGSLFTATDNERALSLYQSLGFTIHRTDRAYEREVAPA